MTTLAAHLPALPNWLAFGAIVLILAIGWVVYEFCVAPLVDEDEQPVGRLR